MANTIFPGDSDRPVVRNINVQASRLQKHAVLPGLTADDIRQELLLDLIRRAPSFDPSKASFPTFADRVVANRIADLARPSARLTAERSTVPLDEPLGSDSLPLVEILPDRAPPIDMAVGLRVDLERFEATLPPHLAACCQVIDEDRVAEVSRRLGIHRSTFHDRLRVLRAAATAAGLGAYLNHPDISATASVCGQEDNPSKEALPNMIDVHLDRGQIPHEPAALSRWAATAEAGDLITYYRGRLAHDIAPDSIDPTPKIRKLRSVASFLWSEHEAGRVLLVQRRLGIGDYIYVAVRSSHGHRP
ncbi:MAG: sigma-70 family RNA polymerase sigma factor [Bauldia sp.]|nr:sigma-70 family RNA polymerase sigma factor [Bauldia sp.]